MSQENVELVRRAFEAYANGGIEELVQYATPDCVFYPDPGWMEESEYRGRDAVIAFNRTQTDASATTSGPRYTTFERSASASWFSPK
jgi:ketosteroid isomerase-like protein